MSKKYEIAKHGDAEGLNPSINAALRELAGWPAQSAEEGGYMHRTREQIVHRDAQGNVTGSTERIREEEFRQYHQFWGK